MAAGWTLANSSLPNSLNATFQIIIGDYPRDSFVGIGTGVAPISLPAGPGPLIELQLPGGGITVTGTVPLTDPENATLVTLMIDPGQPLILPRGTLAPLSGGGPLTQNVLTGVGLQTGNARFKLCVLFPGCGFYLPITITQNGTRGLGMGGFFTVNTFAPPSAHKLSVQGTPWTLGAAVITGIPNRITITPNGGITNSFFNAGGPCGPNNIGGCTRTTITTTRTEQGFIHGPASLTSGTTSVSGVIQVVTPAEISTNLDPPNNFWATIGIIQVHFTVIPEPGQILLLGSGIAGLLMLGRRRMRK